MSQSTRPGNRERGWNDPPEFLHSESGIANQNKRTILNQRVAHSFDGKPDEKNPDVLTEPPKQNAPSTSQICSKKEQEPSQLVNIDEINIESLETILNDNVQYLKDRGIAVC